MDLKLTVIIIDNVFVHETSDHKSNLNLQFVLTPLMYSLDISDSISLQARISIGYQNSGSRFGSARSGHPNSAEGSGTYATMASINFA